MNSFVVDGRDAGAVAVCDDVKLDNREAPKGALVKDDTTWNESHKQMAVARIVLEVPIIVSNQWNTIVIMLSTPELR
jgi:hypothetical protein